MKIKQILFLLSVLVLAVSCGQRQPKTPISDNPKEVVCLLSHSEL